MSHVHFNMSNASTLNGMAPAPMAGGGFGVAALPPGLGGAGIYMIINTINPFPNWNRYIGISTNLANRFNTRMATVTEMGFDAAIMNQILVILGTVETQNTPPPPPPPAPVIAPMPGPAVFPPPLVLGPPAIPPAPVIAPMPAPLPPPPLALGGPVAPPPGPAPGPLPPGMVPVPNYNAPFQVAIDGVQVNLEQLLIRFVMVPLNVGGTVSNNVYAGVPYVNPTPNPVTVTLTWAGVAPLVAGNWQAVWPVGGAGW